MNEGKKCFRKRERLSGQLLGKDYKMYLGSSEDQGKPCGGTYFNAWVTGRVMFR